MKNKPDLVQRFVDASILGWVNYLYGNREAANALMIKDNPEMTEAELEASIGADEAAGHRRLGRVAGRRHRRDERRRASRTSTTQMVKAGLYKPGEVDLSKVATFQFVNKKVGLDVKAKLGGK